MLHRTGGWLLTTPGAFSQASVLRKARLCETSGIAQSSGAAPDITPMKILSCALATSSWSPAIWETGLWRPRDRTHDGTDPLRRWPTRSALRSGACRDTRRLPGAMCPGGAPARAETSALCSLSPTQADSLLRRLGRDRKPRLEGAKRGTRHVQPLITESKAGCRPDPRGLVSEGHRTGRSGAEPFASDEEW